ncbi:MAG: 4-vinyl reductase [Chloroflexota bacterium]|nr:4-vinyl reductase [Chloroflexota bacterium]
MSENRIPALILNILFSQVDEMMGHQSLVMLLRQAGLEQYSNAAPPLDESPSITVEEYSRLLAYIYEIFGPRGSKPLFRRGGRMAAAELRKHHPTRFAVAGTALKLLPGQKRMQIVLDQLCKEGEDIYGTPHRLEEKDDAFELIMEACPYCAGIIKQTAITRQPIIRPVCHIPTALIGEMVEWATGAPHLVGETECMALGALVCRFRVDKAAQ